MAYVRCGSGSVWAGWPCWKGLEVIGWSAGLWHNTGAMTAHEQPKNEPRVFVSAKEIKRTPRPEQTDDEIVAWMDREIQADKKTLDLLAEL
jgi:hypothetical protein